MALFDNVKKETSVMSGDEMACVKRIEELRNNRANLVLQVGTVFLENNSPEKLAGTPYIGLVNQIASVDAEIIYQEKRKLAVKGLRKCEKCGNILVLDSSFCNKCGEKLEPLFAESDAGQPVCPVCGSPYTEGAVFCTACGNKLG